jgi:hypothetical protein
MRGRLEVKALKVYLSHIKYTEECVSKHIHNAYLATHCQCQRMRRKRL